MANDKEIADELANTLVLDIAKNTVLEVERTLMRCADLAPKYARTGIVLTVAFAMFLRAGQALAMLEHMDIKRAADTDDEATVRYLRELADAWSLYPDRPAVDANVKAIMLSTMFGKARAHEQG